jgi:thiamine-phosphate pyrophosphorylase
MNPKRGINGLYALTPDSVDTAKLLQQTRQILAGGACVLQYRNKIADVALKFTQAAALRELTREFGTTYIVNDDAKLAAQIDADGVHLGASDGELAAARSLLGPNKLIGISCYNQITLARAAVSAGADYVAFGAFFPSTVKSDAVVAGVDLLRQARAEFTLPLVAIGGITPDNAPLLITAGADAVAVITALYGAADCQTAAQDFSTLFNQSV